jgi:hypothetical protein
MIPQVTQNLTIWRGITFDSFIITCYQDTGLQIPADITGWIPWSEIRSAPDQTLIFDFTPFISSFNPGIVTIPEIPDEVTITFPEGKFKWDFTMQDPGGERRGPYVVGSCIIKSKITQGQPPE